VRIRQASVSEPLMRCRNELDGVETGGLAYSRISPGLWLVEPTARRGEPAYCLCGARHRGGVSGRQGRNPAGESPVMSIARFGHVAIPRFGAGNQPSYAWCKWSGCHVIEEIASVGATWGPSEYGGLNMKE